MRCWAPRRASRPALPVAARTGGRRREAAGRRDLRGTRRLAGVDRAAQLRCQLGQTDRHFVLDAVSGEIQFGPAVRLADGSLRNYGAVPAEGRVRARAAVPLRRRRQGQRRGPHAVRAQGVDPVRRARREPQAGQGGVDGEDLEAAKVRGPDPAAHARPRRDGGGLRAHRREAAPEVARVACLTGGDGSDAGRGPGARRAGRADRTAALALRISSSRPTRRSSGSRAAWTRAA